jgi:CDP-paratose 2-epimerase
MSFVDREFDLIIECSAEPSVLAGYSEAPDYLINTNLMGTVNCLELARRDEADMVFLSTSRVYPVESLNAIATEETDTRFKIKRDQATLGASELGVAECFPLEGARTLYGTTKLCSELLIQEYAAMYGLRCVINRCGVITGPWQMGKVEQGVFALWVAMHYFRRELSYIGWGGSGKQVRDLLHIEDLAELVCAQIQHLPQLSGQVFNVGGGVDVSLSLLETTRLCRELTGNQIPIRQVMETRPGDVRAYITDCRKIRAALDWRPTRTPADALADIYDWIRAEEHAIRHLWVG